MRNIPTTGLDPDGHCGNTFCQIAAGVAIGVGKFVWNNSPPGMAVNGMRSAIHDAKLSPAAQVAQAKAQLHAAGTVVAAAAGNVNAQAQVAGAVVNAWNNASTTDKASMVTQGVLTAAGIAAGAGVGSGSGAARGMSGFGGIMSAETNAAGGTVYTSVGGIGQDVVGTAVNNAMTGGASEINILSGVHGAADGTMTPAPEFFQADQAAFGNLPGVTVHDMTTLTPAQVDGMVNGPGTTIGAFCNSAACLKK